MAREEEFKLHVTADIADAKRQIDELNKGLQGLNKTASGIGVSGSGGASGVVNQQLNANFNSLNASLKDLTKQISTMQGGGSGSNTPSQRIDTQAMTQDITRALTVAISKANFSGARGGGGSRTNTQGYDRRQTLNALEGRNTSNPAGLVQGYSNSTRSLSQAGASGHMSSETYTRALQRAAESSDRIGKLLDKTQATLSQLGSNDSGTWKPNVGLNTADTQKFNSAYKGNANATTAQQTNDSITHQLNNRQTAGGQSFSVDASKDSVAGFMKQRENSMIISQANNASSTLSGMFSSGADARLQSQSDIDGLTIGSAMQSGNTTNKADNVLLKQVGVSGIKNGTGYDSVQMAQFAGTAGTYTGNSNNAASLANGMSQASRYDNFGTDNTNTMIQQLAGNGSVTNASQFNNVSDIITGSSKRNGISAMNSQQAAGFNTILNTTQGMSMTNGQVQNMAATQGVMGSYGKEMQGQNGANAISKLYSGTSSMFSNPIARSAFASGNNSRYSGAAGMNRLEMDMSEPQKHSTQLSNMITGLSKNSPGGKDQAANLIRKNMGVTADQADDIVNAANSGKLTNKSLNKYAKTSEKDGDNATKTGKSQFDVQGDATINIKNANTQRGNIQASNGADGIRGTLNNFGGSAVSNVAGGFSSGIGQMGGILATSGIWNGAKKLIGGTKVGSKIMSTVGNVASGAMDAVGLGSLFKGGKTATTAGKVMQGAESSGTLINRATTVAGATTKLGKGASLLSKGTSLLGKVGKVGGKVLAPLAVASSVLDLGSNLIGVGKGKSGSGSKLIGGGIGATIGGIAGSVIPGAGTVAGAAIGEGVGSWIGGMFAPKDAKASTKKSSSKSSKSGSKADKTISDADDWLDGFNKSLDKAEKVIASAKGLNKDSDSSSGSSSDTDSDSSESVSKAASAWINNIKKAAKADGQTVSDSQIKMLTQLIQNESGGDAGVLQKISDQNSAAGHPAQGLLQYVPSTFSNFAVSGHKNILNGDDQLLAFFNNSKWASDLAGTGGNGGWSPSGTRIKNAKGGMYSNHRMTEISEGGQQEAVIPLGAGNENEARSLLTQSMGIAGMRLGNTKNTGGNTSNVAMSPTFNITIQADDSGISTSKLKQQAQQAAQEMQREFANSMQGYFSQNVKTNF